MMKKVIKIITTGIFFLVIGYNLAGLCIPNKAFAKPIITLPGRLGSYNGLPVCVCPRINPDCACIIHL
ncbi:MAG: hypothetical protein QW755_07615, partial [Nitrososphaerota archaeon]